MDIVHQTTYMHPDGNHHYHILNSHNYEKAMGYRWMPALEQEIIAKFLNSIPDYTVSKSVFGEHIPVERFVIVAPTVRPLTDNIILGFTVLPRRLHDRVVVEHWNYHPKRRDLAMTHTQSYAPSIGVTCDPEFIKNFRHTFKSLAELAGEEQEMIERFF